MINGKYKRLQQEEQNVYLAILDDMVEEYGQSENKIIVWYRIEESSTHSKLRQMSGHEAAQLEKIYQWTRGKR